MPYNRRSGKPVPIFKEEIGYGPWPGGMNLRDDPEFIQESQLATIYNFEVSDEGRLIPRPATRYLDNLDPTLAEFTPAGYLIGSALSSNGNDITATFKDPNSLQFLYTTDPTTAFSTTTFTGLSVQAGFYEILNYNNFAYYMNQIGPDSFRVALGAHSGAVTLLPNVPNSGIGPSSVIGKAFIFKDRLWVANGNRVNYSKVTDPTIFAAPDGGFFDVGPGDGDNINAIVVSNDTIYIFKETAVWAFRYSTDPGTDGYLQIVSEGKGASNAVVHENSIYTVDHKSVYQFVNGQFQDIGRVLNISPSGNYVQSSIGVWKNRLLVSTGGDFYVLNLNNGAWSIWSITTFSGQGPSKFAYCFDGLNECCFIGDLDLGCYFMTTDAGIIIDKAKDFDGSTNGIIIKYRFPQRNFITKKFAFNTTFNWKKFYALRVEGIERYSTVDGKWFPKGEWAFYDEQLGHITQGYAGAGIAVGQDFERIVTGNFRFRRVMLTFQMNEEVLRPDQDVRLSDPSVVLGSVPYYATPIFHRLMMTIGQRVEV